MKLYFLRSSYKDNVYKLSDFYTGSSITKNENKMFNLNFKADDGATSVVCPTDVLPDNTKISTYTHVYADEVKKIYMIQRTEYVNGSQVKLWLVEDALIANYMSLKDDNIIIERSNDTTTNKFLGINDISESGIDYTSEIIPITNNAHLGKFLLVYLRITDYDLVLANGIRLYLNSVPTGGTISDLPNYFDSVDTFSELITKYPQVTTGTPEKYQYFNKKVRVIMGTTFPHVHQCIFNNGSLKWVDIEDGGIGIPDLPAGSEKSVRINLPLFNKLSNFPDISTVTLAFPYEFYIGAWAPTGEVSYYVSAEQFSGIKVGNGIDIIESRLVDSTFFIHKDQTVNYITQLRPFSQYPFKQLSIFNKNFESVDVKFANDTDLVFNSGAEDFTYKVMMVSGYNKVIHTSLSISTTNRPLVSEPFVKYELNIYGNTVKIPAIFVNSIYIVFSTAVGTINYAVYNDISMTKLISTGSFTLQTKFTKDLLDNFNLNNPTYKEQFTASMWQKGIQSVGGGAIAGGMKGGPMGAVAGAALGGVNAGMSMGFAVHSENLRQKGLSLMPDQMYGDNSSAGFLLDTRLGIFWIKKTPVRQTEMLNEYYLRGFPTGAYGSFDGLVSAPNAIYGPCKYVQGRLLKQLINPFITSEVDKKLQEGVVIIG